METKLWIRLLPIVAILGVDYVGVNMMLPMLPFYAKRFGADAFTVGLLFSTYSLCQIVASPILGSLSDRFGRKRILLLSQVGTLLSFVVMYYAGSLEVLFMARALDGLTGGNVSLAMAYMVDVTKPHERTTALGQQILANGVGLLVGGAIASKLVGPQVRLAVVLAAAFSAVSILCTYVFLKDTKRGAKPSAQGSGLKKAAIISRKTAPAIACLACYHLMWGIYLSGIGIFSAHRFVGFGAKEAGYLYAYMGIFVIALPVLYLPFLVKRLGELKIVFFTFALAAVAFFVMSQIPSWIYLVAVIPMVHFGTIPLRPALVSIFTSFVDKSQHGLALGFNQSLIAAGQIAGPVIGTYAINTGHTGAWPLMPSFLLLVGLSVSFLFIRGQLHLAKLSVAVQAEPSDPPANAPAQSKSSHQRR